MLIFLIALVIVTRYRTVTIHRCVDMSMRQNNGFMADYIQEELDSTDLYSSYINDSLGMCDYRNGMVRGLTE